MGTDLLFLNINFSSSANYSPLLII